MARWCLVAALATSFAAAAWGCGGSLSSKGTFMTPNYPLTYPASSSCTWVITADAGKAVYLSFSAFELESGTNCNYDSVQVYNGPSASSTLVGTYCGVTVPAAITGGSVITVVFKSDSSLHYKGFSAAFQSVTAGSVPTTTAKPAGSCSGNFTSSSGTLASPNYPSLYPNSVACSYTITTPNSKPVLTFTAMDVESSSSCSYDYVEVRDGSCTGTVLQKLCGTALPGKIVASGRTLCIMFVSDTSVPKTGFQATWEELTCESGGGRCMDSCEDGQVNSTLPCSSKGVCCFAGIQKGACGVVSNGFIVGGGPSEIGKWPWQVSLQQRSNNFHFCGGSIINELFIVTAAHCVDGQAANTMQVVAGEYHLKQANDEQVIPVASYVKHERYDGKANGFPNDIALIKLSRPIELNRYAMPICLPELMQVFGPEDICYITGWGDTKGTGDSNILNELLVIVPWHADCVNKWGANYINNGHLCVGTGGKGACNGDSGGPLVCLETYGNQTKWILAGATSWGRTGCQTEGFPSVYTRIAYFTEWIESKIRGGMY